MPEEDALSAVLPRGECILFRHLYRDALLAVRAELTHDTQVLRLGTQFNQYLQPVPSVPSVPGLNAKHESGSAVSQQTLMMKN